jgi:Tfp pilus assembly protein PilO
MSYSMPKTSLVITMGGCLLVSSLFFYFLYMPNRRVLDQNVNQVKELEQKIRVESASTRNIQREIASSYTQNTHLNYFNRLDIKESERIPYLLKSLTHEANALGIKFLSVDPQHPENKELYQKYIFNVEVRATYAQMLRFLHCIENKLKLNIDRFRMSRSDQPNAGRRDAVNPADTSGQVTAKIHINTLEMADSQLKNFDSITQVKEFYLDPNLTDTLAIPSPQFEESDQQTLIAQACQRDPFHPDGVFASSLASLSPDKQTSGEQLNSDEPQILLVKKNDKELVLSAIIDFQEERLAILGQDLVKSGDILKNTQVGNRNVNMKVLNIGENTVTLGDGQEKFILKLPNNPVQFK